MQEEEKRTIKARLDGRTINYQTEQMMGSVA